MCRDASVEKLDAFKGAHHGHTGSDQRPRGHQARRRQLRRRSRRACPDGRPPVRVRNSASCSRLAHLRGRAYVFSCGWRVSRDGKDVYSWKIKLLVHVVGRLARLARVVDLDDQVEACRRVFASNTRWTVVRGSDLEEGESQGLPVWSRHVGDPILASNITRRVDFALFMVAALENDALIHQRHRRLWAAKRRLRSRMHQRRHPPSEPEPRSP